MNIKLWDRTEPLKSVAIWAVGVFILIEAILLLGGKWVLVGQDTWEADNAYYGRYASTPATRSWRELRCNYWTGRSIQTIEVSGEYNPVPMECPFITIAQ